MEFVPRKTITVQVSIDALQKLKDIAVAKGTTRTKIIEGMINQEYERTIGAKDDLLTKQCVR